MRLKCAALPLLFALGASGCVVRREVVVVREQPYGTTAEVVQVVPPLPPRAVVVESVPVSPGSGYLWVAGHYDWRAGRYFWVPGRYYARPFLHARWVHGHWRRHAHGHVWVTGHWR